MSHIHNIFITSAAVFFGTVWATLGQLPSHPEGLITLHQAPSAESSSISIVNFGSEIPGFESQLNSKGGALFCARGFCASPLLDARGLTTINGELFAVDRGPDPETPFLTKIEADFSQTRLPEAIGFPHIEALTWVETKLIAASVDSATGTTTLIEINHETGRGTALDLPQISVMIAGMAWDPDVDQLYAISTPSDEIISLPPSLHVLDLQSGKADLIGPLGKDIQGLTWIRPVGLVGAWDQLYLIHSNTGEILPLTSGPEFVVSDDSGVFALAANGSLTLPPSPNAPSAKTVIPATLSVEGDNVNLKWTANVNTFYEVDYSPTLRHWNWKTIEQFFVGEEGRQNCGVDLTLGPGESAELQIDQLFDSAYKQGFYRIRATEFEPTATLDPLRFLLALSAALSLIAVGKWRQRFAPKTHE